MNSTRARCTTALMAAALGCGLVAAAPVAAIAAPAGHATSSDNKVATASHSDGFYVTGETPAAVSGDSPTALVRDSGGRQHVVTVKASPSASGDQGHVLYLTRTPGEKHWLTREIPGLRPLAGIQVEEHLSWNGEQVFIVLYQCNGVFVTAAPIAAARMPEPTWVQGADTCSNPTKAPKASAPPIAHAIAFPSSTVTMGILLPDPLQGGQETIFVGRPAGTWTPEPAYTEADNFVPAQITVDSRTGRITVIGTGSNGTDEGIYEVSKLYYDPWGAITRIAGLASATSDYTIESVTAYNNSTWVGLLKPPTPGHALKNSLYLVQGVADGQFSGAFPLPHSSGQDTSLVLAINPGTSHLHAAFTRVDPAAPAKKSGIMVEARFGGKWQMPKFLTHWDRDYTDALTLTAKGQAVIGYAQR